jgi:predicted nucleotidyltransferase
MNDNSITINEIIELLAKRKDELREKYGVVEIGIFGSYVRGEQRKKSDIDLLIEFQRPIGMLKFIEMEDYLGEILGRKVDLVTRGALKPHIGKRILEEVRYL